MSSNDRVRWEETGVMVAGGNGENPGFLNSTLLAPGGDRLTGNDHQVWATSIPSLLSYFYSMSVHPHPEVVNRSANKWATELSDQQLELIDTGEILRDFITTFETFSLRILIFKIKNQENVANG